MSLVNLPPLLLLAACGLISTASASQGCIAPTGLDALPPGATDGLAGALASGDLPFLWVPIADPFIESIYPYETPIGLRIAHIHGAVVYNAATKYHPRALDIWGRGENRICQPASNATDAERAYFSLHESISMAYTFYANGVSLIPSVEGTLKPIFESLGMPTDLLKLPGNPDPSTPWGIARIAVADMVLSTANDGWNADGKLTAENNPLPYSDYAIVGVNGVSYTPYSVDPTRTTSHWPWQPLVDSNGLGYFARQEHVVPHIGFTAQLYGMNRTHYESFKAPPPPYNKGDYTYAKLARNIVEATRVMAGNDRQKAMVEYFDSKFNSLLYLEIQYSVRSGISEFEFWYNDMTIHAAMYDAIVIAWREKIAHNKVRPTTVVHELLGDEVVNTYGGPNRGGPRDIPAKEWQPFIRTMPHAEYPSASACICTSYSETFALLTGSDDIAFPLVHLVEAGSLKSEPGVAPSENITFVYNKWSEIARDCGQSRAYGGMHFEPAIPAGHELCKGFTKPVFENSELLLQGDASGAHAVYGKNKIDVSPFIPPYGNDDSTNRNSDKIEDMDWYPNWDDGQHACLNDGNAPNYMKVSRIQISTSKKACCETHFGWDLDTCLGAGQVGSEHWYVDWKLEKCVKDCDDISNVHCGGFANTWDETHGSSLSACCDTIPWVVREECAVKL